MNGDCNFFRQAKVYLSILILILGVACRKNRATEPTRNILLITIDTLRADHLGCYGYPRAATPNIDHWAEKGSLFTNATAAIPLTLPSHSTIMTGQYPFTHGVRDNGGFYLEEKWQTLAETLHSAGFRTGGFVSAFVLDRRWGIAQGFEEYFDHFELSKFKMVSLDSVQRRGDETLTQALSWVDKNKASRFFAWIHFYDPHTPYDPPEPFRTEFKGQGAMGLYDGEIAFTDNLIGRVHKYLEDNNLLSTTLVVLTSDHGESLGEHQESAHGFFIYDATMHVPLLIWKPGEEPRKISEQVRSVDLFPTICEAAGVQAAPSGSGVSLLPLVRGDKLPKTLTAYSESYYPKFHYGWSELKSLRTSEYKYIEAPRREFYRVSQDSGEKENIYEANRQRVANFESELSRLIASEVPAIPQAMDNDSLEKLQALGYIGSHTFSSEPSGPLPDPKDKIRLYNLIKQAQGLSAENELKEAFSKIRDVIRQDPKILEAYLVLGNLYTKEKDFATARTTFQTAVQLSPDSASAIFGLAKAYKDEGNLEAAKTGFERLRQIDPKDTKSYFQLGDIALIQKQFDQALIHYRKIVELDPDQAVSHSRLGACYVEAENYDEGSQELRKALELNPRIPNAHFNLALIHEARGEWDSAIAEYEAELSVFPETYPARFNLARIYRLKQNRDEERRQLEACIQDKPEYGVAYLYLAKNIMDSSGDLAHAKDLTEKGIHLAQEKDQMAFGHYLLADIFNRMGLSSQALEQIRQARKLSPKS